MIESITLTDFRNHKQCRIQTGGRRNIIITGPNGAGKTAVIEAVSMLSGDRGLRGAAMSDIARFGGAGGFSVFAKLSDDTDMAVTFAAGESNRRAMIDGEHAALADCGRRLRMVWVTPREDRLFMDGAEQRRAFFDRMAAGFDAAHAGRVARLSKLLSERAFALRSGADAKWMDALDMQIASVAVAVAAARVRYAGEVNFFLEHIAVSVSGMVEGALISSGDARGAEEMYLAYLRENRQLVNDKMTVDGPHRSDFAVFNRAISLPANLTSTGQQKSALIDLILAHARLIHTKTGMRPIILLDEAAAHLDANARTRVFEELAAADAQVWATGVDAASFAGVRDAAFVTCLDGEISNIVLAG